MRPLSAPTFKRTWMEKFKSGHSHSTIPSGYSIEEVEPTNYRILKLIKDVGEKYGWHRFPRFNNAEYINEMVNNPQTRLFELHLDNECVGGCIVIQASDGEGLELEIFGLYPQYTNHGMGKHFAQMIMDELFKETDRIMLITRDSNIDGVYSFYKTIGMQIYKEAIIKNDLDQQPSLKRA